MSKYIYKNGVKIDITPSVGHNGKQTFSKEAEAHLKWKGILAQVKAGAFREALEALTVVFRENGGSVDTNSAGTRYYNWGSKYISDSDIISGGYLEFTKKLAPCGVTGLEAWATLDALAKPIIIHASRQQTIDIDNFYKNN